MLKTESAPILPGNTLAISCRVSKKDIYAPLVLRTENPCANISVYFPDCTSPEYST